VRDGGSYGEVCMGCGEGGGVVGIGAGVAASWSLRWGWGGGGWALELCGTALCLLSVVRLGGFVHASYVSIRCMLVSMHGSRLGAR